MFSDIITLNNEAQSELLNFNRKIEDGELAITDTNDNKRTDEIIDNIESMQQDINSLYDDISTINTNINSFEAAINQSKEIRRQELLANKNEDPDGELDIRDIMGD